MQVPALLSIEMGKFLPISDGQVPALLLRVNFRLDRETVITKSIRDAPDVEIPTPSEACQICLNAPFRYAELLGNPDYLDPGSPQHKAEIVLLVGNAAHAPEVYPYRNANLLAMFGGEKPRPNDEGKRFLVIGFDRT